ncbi:MAG: hypothetical protein H0W34_00930 [Pyrinomonadaceae bacterium]|nr:hypothetical protein [Pyrinomonadaceae bacterium]
MRAQRLQNALRALEQAIQGVTSALAEVRSHQDPLASHIFVSRQLYQAAEDTKGGRRHAMSARLSFEKALDLGFRGSLDEWERLLGAAAK